MTLRVADGRRSRGRGLVLGAVALVLVGAVLVDRVRRSSDAEQPSGASGTVVLLGDSITEQGNWARLLPDQPVVNRGYSGYTSEQLVPIARDVAADHPAQVFVLAGTNDIRDHRPASWSAGHLEALVASLEQGSPETKVVLQTVLPRHDAPDAVAGLNDEIRRIAEAHDLEVLDLHAEFDDGTGGLRAAETTDGVHLTAAGYRRWAGLLTSELG